MDDPVAVAAILLRQVAKAVEALTEEEKTSLLAGEASLRIAVESKTRHRRTPQSNEEMDVEALRERLESCRSRTDAHRIIEDMSLSKVALRQISKSFELHFTKDDTTDRLVERIVEATVGFRLRSQAIQGKAETTKDGDLAVQHEAGNRGDPGLP
jgi:hypothetical protein